MSRARVLLVDGEPEVRRLLRRTLATEGYRTFQASTGEQALTMARTKRPDVILLELELPDMDGDDLIVRLRAEWTREPLLVVSSRQREEDKVAALELGADDYLTKPFGTGELLARIRVALRRRKRTLGDAARPVIEIGDLKIDLDRRLVFKRGHEVHLTPYEYELFACLMRHAGKVVTHAQLLKEVWGPAQKEERTYLRVYMASLRKKLELDPSRPRHILTEQSIGYRLRDSSDDRIALSPAPREPARAALTRRRARA